MVAFRKLFFVLAIAALLLGSSTASAQITTATPLSCIANAGNPPLVRAEGLTELVGDVLLICTGGNPVAPFLANFQLFLNTNITSRLVGTDLSEALLLVDEPLIPRADIPGAAATPSTPLCLAPVGSNSVTNAACNDPLLRTGPAGASNYQTGSYTAFRANTKIGRASCRERVYLCV